MMIRGETVTLRAIELADCELLRRLINDPETEYCLGGWSFPVSEAEQRRWYESAGTDRATLRVMIDAGGTAVGTAILSDIDYKNGNAQAHIKLLPGECRRKGYGSDAMQALVRYAFAELRLHCVYARVSEHNLPSQGLFEKCGFVREGLMRDRLYKKGGYINVLLYSILAPTDGADA